MAKKSKHIRKRDFTLQEIAINRCNRAFERYKETRDAMDHVINSVEDWLNSHVKSDADCLAFLLRHRYVQQSPTSQHVYVLLV